MKIPYSRERELDREFNIDARIIGRVEDAPANSLTIRSEFGEFRY